MSAATTRVSPTAYATGYFWYRHGLSDAAFATPQGKRLDAAFGLLARVTQRLSGVSLDALMLARHRGIDARLAHAIETRGVTQVIEIAAGLSARGWRFARDYGERITYIETDLPAMAATKRELLERAGSLSARHRVVELDALARTGPQSLAAVAASLDPRQPTAIITEGLMNYLPADAAESVWRRLAATLRGFPAGVYLSDLYLMQENRGTAMLAFGAILSVFVRGRMNMHFGSQAEALRRMRSYGFANAAIHRSRDLPEIADVAYTPGADRVRVLEAWATGKQPPTSRRTRAR